ncbi:MAG TPA: YceI family protein [Gaiellaceae bacterium]|nr:YceI family protein [Gaiellaceae bacterium]
MAVLTEGRTALPTGSWALDPVHSTIGFELPYLAGTFRGHFTDANARLTADSLAGAARVASVDVKDENLAAHLQSPEFFDVERYPELTFASDSVESSGDELKVHGEITIRGITKPVELVGTIAGPMTDGFGNERVNVQLETTVDRTELGLNWNMPLPTGQPALQNEVKLVAELYFVREA